MPEFRTHDSAPRTHGSPPQADRVTFREALAAEGLVLPERCVNVTLVEARDASFVLSFDWVVRGDDVARVGRALARMAGVSFP